MAAVEPPNQVRPSIDIDEALREGVAEEREVDVCRPPRVAVVLPRVRARLDRREAKTTFKTIKLNPAFKPDTFAAR